MDPDDFLDLMCLALDTGDDENDSQGQRSGKRYELIVACWCSLGYSPMNQFDGSLESLGGRASEHNDDDGGLGGIDSCNGFIFDSLIFVLTPADICIR